MSHFGVMDIEELQSYFSDFHKDYYGFRPRFATAKQWRNRDFLIENIGRINDAIDERKKTPEGRASLRADGWHIDERENPKIT